MVRRAFRTLFVASLVTLLPLQARGHDYFEPDWRGVTGSLTAEWDLWESNGDEGFKPDTGAFETWPAAGISEPYIEVANGVAFEIAGTHLLIDSDPWVFYIDADNFDTANPLKEVRLQVTWMNGTLADTSFNFTDFGGTNSLNWEQINYVGSQQDGDWITEAWDFAIYPNPEEERIWVTFAPDDEVSSILIDQVVLDTICTVPIPTGIWLLGSGLLGLVGIRRRSEKGK
ncbi:MAG: VPLPA-CTERM sorting domain-containing protein [Thermodesulfobacteriota bacterium]|nr:VPLPA-CTERM sorting domain-containing protein [Thermodesulfobacteriota bacterium]